MQIAIINGPNLNLLGKRETGIYGSESFENYFKQLEAQFPDIQFSYYQNNVEGELVNYLHEVGFSYDGILLNAGAYTHTSVAIRDAIAGIKTPVLEIHISNVYAREEFRHTSLIAPKCVGGIYGLGLKGYHLGVEYFLLNKA
ncbi:3-dehydroquinate dehydratase [Chitinophaga terrae (ex Kim and Jung 2007)]|jgi:3-dehydroquinate dehydratase-2|uniref:3-dehydroquinate dehydratase n=1 Tax=Chitinophaga terrae (ex Kim and Jung 2007) TaxID=408074 RepID=A0A1H4BJT4_9BACT|nr:type II 3-dehydroquinate dehydratase [Chitinophaga terrae (ex Kim and Jung 2007)]MDQ0109347.1 3-dehydroquinate dehydratase-2 [Chitinophaga terrae (ex Kim and Jung 2007)]GEP89587.1 3-dehydroquinate dehydratase [Chitinophaga terrae (ex Kim and Jung 2007)]SEA48072.1 3-dehydroquinate dehydratase [Chitinophaga terrae (ex Kim and Jung 2007)]